MRARQRIWSAAICKGAMEPSLSWGSCSRSIPRRNREMGRRHDDRPIKRPGPTRPSKHRILIVCEGKTTEPGYFKALQHEVRNPRLHVKAIGPAGVPVTVVETAISEKLN